MATKQEQVDLFIDSDDEFESDYESPGSLSPDSISGSVIYTVDWTVSTVVSQIDSDPDDPESAGVLVTAPPFQRRTAWTVERQGLFIESLMLGLPIPPLVLAESQKHEGQFYVLDGKQRLTALQRFFDPIDPLRLQGLEILDTELRNRTLTDISNSPDLRKYLRSLSTQPIRTVVVRNWGTPALLHLIFSRLNKASVPLASHELRQALFPGSFTNYINSRSSSSEPLRRARRLSEPDFRLRDAETLLRYISFKTNSNKYGGDLRDFLDRNLQGGNDHFSEIADEVEHEVLEMENAITATFQIFDRAAFLRFDPQREKYLPRFNVAVFDTMTWFLSDPSVRREATKKQHEVKRAFEKLSTGSPSFNAYLTSTTKTSQAVVGRLAEWGSALSEVVGRPLEYASFRSSYLPMAPPSRRQGKNNRRV